MLHQVNDCNSKIRTWNQQFCSALSAVYFYYWNWDVFILFAENIYVFVVSFQDSFYSVALKSLISVSTIILLGLILAYHALEVQVSGAIRLLGLILAYCVPDGRRAAILWAPSCMHLSYSQRTDVLTGSANNRDDVTYNQLSFLIKNAYISVSPETCRTWNQIYIVSMKPNCSVWNHMEWRHLDYSIVKVRYLLVGTYTLRQCQNKRLMFSLVYIVRLPETNCT